MNPAQEIEALKNALHARITDPEKRQLLVALTTDLTLLGSQALAGRDVDREVDIVKATALNLTAAESVVVADIFTEWATGFIAKLVGAGLGVPT